ncbi:MAG: nitroreductase [Micropepsaceae bacterium]
MSPPTLNDTTSGTLNLLKSRRSGSAKAMVGPGPTDSQIQELLVCATRVPDHGKLAPWRFIVFTGDARAEFGEILVGALHNTESRPSEERIAQERGRFLRAPVVIAVISRAKAGLPIPEWEQILSAGACCQTLCIAAHAMGFVAGWITEWYAYDPTVRAKLALSAEERIAGFVHLGKPKEPLVDRPRPSLESVVTYFGSN